MFRKTSAAACAIRVTLVPLSFSMTSPPFITSTSPEPCGSRAVSLSLSTLSGSGAPIQTFTNMSSAS